MDPAKLQELKSNSPTEVAVYSVSGVDIVLRAPSRMEYRAWKANVRDERKRLDAPELLLNTCVLSPPIAELQTLFDRKPALIDTLSSKALELAGLQEDVEKKEQ